MNSGKKRILIFLMRIPYPPVDGTRSKILNNVVKGLAREFELEFLIVTDEGVNDDQVKFLEDNFGRVFLFSFKRWPFIFRALRYVFSSLPIQVGYYFNRKADAWFKANIRRYDAVYVHELRLGRYLEGMQEKERDRLLIDFNDAISLTYTKGKRFASVFWRIVFGLEEKRVRLYEIALLRKFKNFSIVSEDDRRYLVANVNGFSGQIRFEVIPHGVDSGILSYSPSFGKKIAFMGNLGYPPNQDAVDYFCERIWPSLKSRVRDVRFVVIGKGGNGLEKKYPDVLFTGFQDDPYGLIAECSAFVAPVRFGAGVQTKSLEAMAVGVPVVTTPVGVQGILGAQDGENIFVIEEGRIDEWTSLLTMLLNDSSIAKRVGGQAKRLIESQHSDVIAQEHFRKVFSAITTSNGNGLI